VITAAKIHQARWGVIAPRRNCLVSVIELDYSLSQHNFLTKENCPKAANKSRVYERNELTIKNLKSLFPKAESP